MKSTRRKALATLGLSEDDVKTSETLFQQLPIPPIIHRTRGKLQSPDTSKAESLMGYATFSLQREKALKVLGTSEEDIEIENSKSLGALGQSGRRRSYLKNLGTHENYRHSLCSSSNCLKRRRNTLDMTIKPHSSKKKRKRIYSGLSTGLSKRTKKYRKPQFASDKAMYTEEMNRLKEALFLAQANISQLEIKLQRMEEKIKKNENSN